MCYANFKSGVKVRKMVTQKNLKNNKIKNRKTANFPHFLLITLLGSFLQYFKSVLKTVKILRYFD
jgi:hypothetical protein